MITLTAGCACAACPLRLHGPSLHPEWLRGSLGLQLTRVLRTNGGWRTPSDLHRHCVASHLNVYTQKGPIAHIVTGAVWYSVVCSANVRMFASRKLDRERGRGARSGDEFL